LLAYHDLDNGLGLIDVAASWDKPRSVIAKAKWCPGELYPGVGFIVTNQAHPAERITTF